MTKIARHQADEVNYAKKEDIFQESFLSEGLLSRIHNILENIENWDLNSIGNSFLDGFFIACYLSEIEWAKKFWVYTNGITHIIFDLSLNIDEDVVLEYNGKQKTVKGFYPGLKIYRRPVIFNCWYWVNRTQLALITRNTKQINNLQQIVTETMFRKIEQYGGINPDLIDPIFHTFYLHLLRKDYQKALIEVRDIIEKITKEPNQYFKNYNYFSWKREHVDLQLVPYFRCLESVLAGNQSQFDEWLNESLLKHKEWAMIKAPKNEIPNSNAFSGFVSIPLLVACCLAYDKGMEINVESDYIPEWLIRNEQALA